jgi:hypothetical protein
MKIKSFLAILLLGIISCSSYKSQWDFFKFKCIFNNKHFRRDYKEYAYKTPGGDLLKGFAFKGYKIPAELKVCGLQNKRYYLCIGSNKRRYELYCEHLDSCSVRPEFGRYTFSSPGIQIMFKENMIKCALIMNRSKRFSNNLLYYEGDSLHNNIWCCPL